MKKLFTLAAAASLAAASLTAQAQTVTVDGVLNTAEIGGTGGYVLIGKYTNARGFGDAGLLSLYAATTATKVTFFLGGTVETNGNSFQLYFKTPASAGVPAGTALPNGPAGGGPVTSSAGTSFEKMGAKLDMATNLAIALRGTSATTFKLEGISYTSATAATAEPALTGATVIAGTGAASTVSATTIAALASARVAYRTTADGKLVGATAATPSNPGAIATTAAGYGAAGSYGLEFELDRAAAGLTGTVAMQVFAVQNNGDGGFLSTDFIPQSTLATAPNPGTNPDFTNATLFPGTQAATLNLTATGLTLGTKAADAAAVALGVYPNPVQGASTVTYQVTERASNVNIVLTDLLGRTVRIVENGLKAVGTQTASLNAASLAAGTYLVRVQVGDKVSTSKVSVL